MERYANYTIIMAMLTEIREVQATLVALQATLSIWEARLQGSNIGEAISLDVICEARNEGSLENELPVQGLAVVGSEMKPDQRVRYSHISNGESVWVSSSNSVRLTKDLKGSHEVHAVVEDGIFQGFPDPDTGTLYRNPSAMCQAFFTRNGKTNQWAGPDHCYLIRGDIVAKAVQSSYNKRRRST